MQAAQSAESTVAQSTAVIEATRLAKYSLTAVIAAMQGNNPLPNPDIIARNHKSWMETTKQMGVTKKLSKCPHPAKDSGLTVRSIGIVKGKRCCIHNDPYAGGERSGKRVRPDAPSPANAPPPQLLSPPPGSHFWVPRSLRKHAQLFLLPLLLPGSHLWALQSLCKRMHLHIPPPTLPRSRLWAPNLPCFCKHSSSMGWRPWSSLPCPHNSQLHNC